MTKRKNPVVYAARDKEFQSDCVCVYARRPTQKGGDFNNSNGWWHLFDHKQFSRITGLKLKPGECKAIRINVEVVKP